MPVNGEWIDLSVAGLTIADLVVEYLDLESDPQVNGNYGAGDGVTVEYADAATLSVLGGPSTPAPATTFRLIDFPDYDFNRRIRVSEQATPANTVVFDLDHKEEQIDEIQSDLNLLVALFQPAPAQQPITITFNDQTTNDPISGVTVTVWDDTLTTPVIPQVSSTTAGEAKFGLPDGSYKVFYFKPHAEFQSALPVDLVVAGNPVSIPEIVVTDYPALPTLPRVTFFGWILRPDATPVVGAEVELRLLATPQIMGGGAALSKFRMTATTDASGKFELFPLGGTTVLVTSNEAGYSRRGRLPLQGSLNWMEFAKEDVV